MKQATPLLDVPIANQATPLTVDHFVFLFSFLLNCPELHMIPVKQEGIFQLK